MLDNLSMKVVKNKKWILLAFVILTVAAAICIPFVGINYDLTSYLPDDMETTKAIGIMNEEFGANGTCNVVVKKVSVKRALEIKNIIIGINGVQTVMWIDDLVGSMKPEGMDMAAFINLILASSNLIPKEFKGQIESFYKESTVKFQLIMTGNDYSRSTSQALTAIDKQVAEKCYFIGMSASAFNNVSVTMSETLKAAIILVPIIILILIIATTSWLDPVLILLAIGVSIVLNMGTNLIMGQISFLTMASGAILQLALSMDYSIFLLHRYKQEKEKGLDAKPAMAAALRHCLSPISASSLTTIAGFVALMFMRYKIGMDMGLVLAKGILISLLTVFLLLPALIVYCDKGIEKSKHKNIFFRTKAISTGIKKTRYILPIIIIAIIIPTIIAQGMNTFLYGDKATMGGEGSRLDSDRIAVEEIFDVNNNFVILVKGDNYEKQAQLAERIMALDNVETSTFQSYGKMYNDEYNKQVAIVRGELIKNNPNATAEEIEALLSPRLPSIKDGVTKTLEIAAMQLNSDNYTRIVGNLLLDEETPETLALVEEIKAICSEVMQDDEYYLTGASVAVGDIKQVVEKDFKIVNIMSLALIAIILLFTYKSAILPVILLAVIQGSIWINMALPYLMGKPLIFIGYMIVSAVQLGATIDYGILFASRYIEARQTMGRFDANTAAFKASTQSVLTSGGILCAAGFVIQLSSSMPGMSVLGMLIGQGALCSMLLVLILLPQLLMVFDKLIRRTTYKGMTRMIDERFLNPLEPPPYAEQLITVDMLDNDSNCNNSSKSGKKSSL